MQKIALLVVVVVALVAVWLWSAGRPRQSSQSAGDTVAVVLPKSSDGHFYADALINGKQVRFLVDTGATAVALTEDDARRAGIEFDPATYRFLGDGASGAVRGQQVRLASLRIGEIETTDVDAAVVQGATVSLLGLPFLDEIDQIVIEKSEMSLKKRR